MQNLLPPRAVAQRVEPSAPKEREFTVRRGFKRLAPCPTHCTLPAPSGLFANPKPSTSNIPPAIQFSDPGAPNGLHGFFKDIVAKAVGRLVFSTTRSLPRIVFECLLPSQLHVSRHTAQLRGRQREGRLLRRAQQYANFGRQRLPAILLIHMRKLPSPMPVHAKTTQISLDTSHTSSKNTSSTHHLAAPIKSNTVDMSVHPCMNDVSTLFTRCSCRPNDASTKGLSRE